MVCYRLKYRVLQSVRIGFWRRQGRTGGKEAGTDPFFGGASKKYMKNRKNRIFSWRVKGSLIIVAALIMGSLILAFALYGAEPGSELWQFRDALMSGG